MLGLTRHLDRTESMRAGPPALVLLKALPRGISLLYHIKSATTLIADLEQISIMTTASAAGLFAG